ncbi:MAG: GDSL-type esterase/lipase family protein [Sediminicola sp.]
MKNSIRFCAVMILLMILSSELLRGQVKMDSLYRPASYPLKVDQFKSYPDSPNDIIFLGNSITAGTDWSELLENASAKNRGISGDTTYGILERLDEVVEGRPAKVFLLIGINDISRNIADRFILRNIRKITERILEGSPRTQVFVQTLLPVNNSFSKYKNHYNKDGHIATVNTGLKDLEDQLGITLVDLHPHFLDGEGRLDARFTHDGLHLNADGYAHWATLLQPFLK